MIKLKGIGYSDKGAVKSKNEDAYLFRIKNSDNLTCGLFAVSDGVGGWKNGDVASSYIMSELDKWWNGTFYNGSDKSNIMFLLSSLENLICEANLALIKYGKGQNERCGATLSILFIYDSMGYVFHIGDSRIYHMSKKRIKYAFDQVTEDHSKIVERQTINGIVKKSYLTECIGARENVNIFHTEFKVFQNDIYMLCSDGIYKHQSDNEIAKILSKKFFHENICRQLADKAIINGETDNVTAVVVRLF
jgi:PP2C phosphatase family